MLVKLRDCVGDRGETRGFQERIRSTDATTLYAREHGDLVRIANLKRLAAERDDRRRGDIRLARDRVQPSLLRARRGGCKRVAIAKSKDEFASIGADAIDAVWGAFQQTHVRRVETELMEQRARGH